jgi:photosystem II stability/assembly factor-like uncharacterized protein
MRNTVLIKCAGLFLTLTLALVCLTSLSAPQSHTGNRKSAYNKKTPAGLPPGTWSALTSGTTNNLFSVHFVNDNEGWAVGFSNTILHTTNGGGTWTAQTNQSGVTVSSYLGVRFLDSNIGWAGGGSEVVRTTDGGASWTGQGATQDGRFRNNLFAVSSTAAWIPARNSTLTVRWFSRFTVGVGEQNFNVLGGSSQYFDMYFTDIDNGWAVGTGPIVHITNGSSASPSFGFQTSCPCPTLNGIHMLNSITGWAVGNGGLILKTTDGGSTWPAQTSGTTTNLRSVHFVDANTGWAVGNGGLILASTDGGATWTPETSGVTADLRRVFFVNANTGYVVGNNGTILKRTNAPQPMTFVVTNTNDSGVGSLRKAIADANANPEDDTIIFNIPTSDPNFDGSTFSIRPSTGEYTLTDAGTFIDGASQAAFTGNTNASGPEIVIDGSACPTSDCDGFTVQSSNNRIHSLVINQMFGSGIKLEAGATGNTITGCYIGTNPSGTAPSSFFDQDGIVSAGGNIIGGPNPGDGNLISGCGNGPFGGLVLGSNDQVRGNKIGTNAAGTGSVENSFYGIKVAGSNVIIENNLISGNGTGIFLTGAGATSNTIRGNKIGTDITGTADVGNGSDGIAIDGSTNNTIGGTTAADRNIISGNNQNGIRISGSTATGNLVQGNYIGTDVTGTVALSNNQIGVNIILNAPGNTIGGTTASARNIISGNNSSGISISGSTATGNMVQGNYIGTDVTGAAALGNGLGVGVFGSNNTIGGTAAGAGNLISGNQLGMETNSGTGNLIQGNLIGTNAAGTAALGNTSGGILCGSSNNTIGGTVAGARNIISGNGGHGVRIRNTGGPTPPPSGNQVIGNYIGTDVTGAIDLGNAQDGVHIIGGSSNTIGGTSIAARNVISGNDSNGVNINSTTTNDNTVQGNLIGLQADGATAMPNSQAGVLITGPGLPSNNTIGGAAAGAGNVIANNGAGGVVINFSAFTPGTGNPVLSNSIFSNTGLGIDLGPAGVTPNDAMDADTGANNLQNFPVLTLASSSGGIANVQGTLNSTPSATFTIEFFSNPSCDGSGNGEGATFLGSTTVMTGGSGNASFDVTFAATILPTHVVTATATDAAGNTSEISACEPLALCIASPVGVVSWWPADGDADDIVGGNNGALQNGATFAAGRVGQAFSLDGVDDYVATTNNFIITETTGFTVEFWFNPTGLPTDALGYMAPVRFRGSSEFLFALGQSGNSALQGNAVYFGFRGHTAMGTGNATYFLDNTLNQWRHYAVEYLGGDKESTSSYKLYIDGSLVGLQTQGVIGGSDNVNEIGRDGQAGGGTGFVKGLVDELAVFSRVLSASEIQAIYNASSAGKCKCPYSVSPDGQFFPSKGGESSANVLAAPSCKWDVTTDAGWIVIVSDDNGTGNGAVSYVVRDNFSANPRSGVIAIGEQRLTVIQAGQFADCAFAIAPLFDVFDATGGEGSINVTTTSECAWKSESNKSWITITTACCGVGNGSVGYTIAPNLMGSGRSGVITINGQKFNVKQK